jgi:hypothetical protein
MNRYNFYIATVIESGTDEYHFDCFFVVVIQTVPNVPIMDNVAVVYITTDDRTYPNITDQRVKDEFRKQMRATVPINTEGVDEIKAVEQTVKSFYVDTAKFYIKQFQ